MLVQLFQINIYFLFSYGPTPRDTNLKRIKHKKGDITNFKNVTWGRIRILSVDQ